MKKLTPMLFVISIAGWFTIGTMSLSIHPIYEGWGFLGELITYITLFFPLALQLSIFVVAIIILIKYKQEGFTKHEKINIYGSMLVSGVFISLFLFIWYGLMTQGIH